MTNTSKVLSIIIPCYNEALTIGEVIEKTAAAPLPLPWSKEIIVVDDGSDSETKTALAGLEKKSFATPVRILYLPNNKGKGAAVKKGLEHATGDYCIIQDADLELDPNEYPALLTPIIDGESDAVFGYRMLVNPDAEKNTILFYGGRTVFWFYNLLFRRSFKDVPCCYKLFPRSCVPQLLATPSNDFVFDAVEMTYIIDRAHSITQIPVTYRPRSRKEGKKINWRHGLYTLAQICLLRLGIVSVSVSKTMPRFFRFLVSGIISVIVNTLLLYVFAKYAGIQYLAASMLAFMGSWFVNFNLHKFWTFKYEQHHSLSMQLPSHLLLGLINLGVNIALMYVFVSKFHIWYISAQILTLFIIACETFSILSRFIFKQKQ